MLVLPGAGVVVQVPEWGHRLSHVCCGAYYARWMVDVPRCGTATCMQVVFLPSCFYAAFSTLAAVVQSERLGPQHAHLACRQQQRAPHIQHTLCAAVGCQRDQRTMQRCKAVQARGAIQHGKHSIAVC